MRSVLIVDDDQDIRELLCHLLKSRGYHPFAVNNGREALTYLEVDPLPCAIVLDLMTPIMSGWDFLNRRSQDERLSQVPVIVLSAIGGQNVLRLEGITALLEKPASPESIVKAVQGIPGCA